MQHERIYDPNAKAELPEQRAPIVDVDAARKVIAKQRATAPADGDLSPSGSLRRAAGVIVGGFGYDGMRTYLGDMNASFDGWPHGDDGPQRLAVES
jgi:hypothetical protein